MPEIDHAVDSPREDAEPLALRSRVIDHLAVVGQTTPGELQERFCITNREARDVLARLARSGHALRIGRGVYAPATATPALTEVPLPPTTGRRRWGSVSFAAREALAREPGRQWRAADFAAVLGINDKHALVILTSECRAGRLDRVAPGVYATATLPGAAHSHRDPRRKTPLTPVADTDDGLVLVDSDGTMWLAKRAAIVAS